jgi:hypothetical protein
MQKPTDFGAFVIQILSQSTRKSQRIDQDVLRQCLGLASSFLLTDTSMNPEQGISTWFLGVNRLVDVLVALHTRNELDHETVNAASKACSECWSAAGSWRGLEECREGVRTVAKKLQQLLDPNRTTYRGSYYTPPQSNLSHRP